MSKSVTGWLLAICLCMPLTSCMVGAEDDLEDEAAEGAVEPATEEGEPAVDTADCQFSVQCDPCQPPWVQQTAQRTWDSCGASGTMWAIEYYCALCD